MTGGIVALGDEEVFGGAVCDGLVKRDWWALLGKLVQLDFKQGERDTYHELLLNLSKTLQAGSKLEVAVMPGFLRRWSKAFSPWLNCRST